MIDKVKEEFIENWSTKIVDSQKPLIVEILPKILEFGDDALEVFTAVQEKINAKHIKFFAGTEAGEKLHALIVDAVIKKQFSENSD